MGTRTKMAADLNEKEAARTTILQGIQYWDDYLEAWFEDGSKLGLTGCGTAFTLWSRARAPHSGRLEERRIHQYTEYATSEHRARLEAALAFRNTFAERAYVSRSLADKEQVTRNLTDQSNWNNEDTATSTSTLLPTTCPNPHLHAFSDSSVQDQSTMTCYCFSQQQQTVLSSRPVKVLLSEGIVYRILPPRNEDPSMTVEAYPSPFSSTPSSSSLPPSLSVLLRSRDPEGRFFSLWSAGEKEEEEVREQVLSTEHPPPSSALTHGFSLARVMGQARRLLLSVRGIQISEVPACWKVQSPPAPPTPPHLLGSTHVPGLGRFTTHSNGRVRVAFADRTTLDLYCPTLSPAGQRGVSAVGGASLVPGKCRVMLPNGREEMVSTTHPMHLARYVQAAMDWCRWLSAPPETRGGFYQGTVYDENTRQSVLAEVEKIRQFDGRLATRELGGKDEGKGRVHEALQRTARTLRDIDQVLARK